MKKPYAIIIMDGYGINPDKKGNAIELEGSPNVKRYEREYPSSQLGASGMSVGLPEGQMGNSEVGHLNMGAGRIVYQELTKITKEIQDGEFFKNEALLGAMENAKKNGKKLHIWHRLCGIISSGTAESGLYQRAGRRDDRLRGNGHGKNRAHHRYGIIRRSTAPRPGF